jgi:hypothetical protein
MKKFTAIFTLFLLLFSSVPLTVFGQSKSDVLIKNATVMTAGKGTLQGTDILVQNGKITKIGKALAAPAGVRTIDATGKYVTPGIIDCHSHSMLDAINEGSFSVTSMTRTRDLLNPSDITIYRALAGGVTAANLLHGSANSTKLKTTRSRTPRRGSSSQWAKTSSVLLLLPVRELRRRVIRGREWALSRRCAMPSCGRKIIDRLGRILEPKRPKFSRDGTSNSNRSLRYSRASGSFMLTAIALTSI